ncbi:hypothetical protein BELL_0070g00230 [Botrytis elliptica]|uniref:Uncharacterized protein n=1 Tax=Botrytis elliptica TaxID=278938 RepID=A0A4Z1JXS8_9HELO|nr:hypothetical protein EAE99_010508 [Botrytis elliptica]TGO78338.1 hypothetical protein BELL_0070g00230 [Botrytis elliptica]
MHLSHITSAIAILCVLTLSFASAIDRFETSSGTNKKISLDSRGNFKFKKYIKSSKFCSSSAKKPSACMVAYGITNIGHKDDTPIEVGTFAFPCDGDANLENFNHEKSTKFYGLNQAIGFTTFITTAKPDYNNVILNFEKYGPLKGQVHAPVLSIDGHQLPLTNITLVAKTWPAADEHLIWVASYPCKK